MDQWCAHATYMRCGHDKCVCDEHGIVIVMGGMRPTKQGLACVDVIPVWLRRDLVGVMSTWHGCISRAMPVASSESLSAREGFPPLHSHGCSS
jgi:hypothetical protein